MARVDVGSGVSGSRTMIFVEGGREWASRRARKRPTQPPPAIMIGGFVGVVSGEMPLVVPLVDAMLKVVMVVLLPSLPFEVHLLFVQNLISSLPFSLLSLLFTSLHLKRIQFERISVQTLLEYSKNNLKP